MNYPLQKKDENANLLMANCTFAKLCIYTLVASAIFIADFRIEIEYIIKFKGRLC